MINRLLGAISRRLQNFNKMSDQLAEVISKRPAQEDLGQDLKRVKVDESKDRKEASVKLPKRKKVALLTVYSGKNYHGCQVQTQQPHIATVEAAFVRALLEADLITQEHVDDMSKMWFQRASRTDKGVSAAGQVFSLLINKEDIVERINTHLPTDIKVLAVKKATKNFDAKNNCSYRTYEYLCPTFAFAPLEEQTNEDFRISVEMVENVNQVMQTFKGTHNFHNFTSRRKPYDPSSKRYMMSFEAGKPFVLDGIEFLVITIRGQSFMLHQIRKMIGLTMAVVRGFASTDTIELCWGPSKVDIPKAPALGLLLDKLHYDGYNKRFGSDGIHEPIDWLQYKKEIEKFKMEHIYADIMKTEKEEMGMFTWLKTLPLHSYQMYVDQPPNDSDEGNDEEKSSKFTSQQSNNSEADKLSNAVSNSSETENVSNTLEQCVSSSA